VVDRFGNERTTNGVTLPTRFRAGSRLGEPDAFPFFEARLDANRFGASPAGGDRLRDTPAMNKYLNLFLSHTWMKCDPPSAHRTT
jgi:hypothetical protein